MKSTYNAYPAHFLAFASPLFSLYPPLPSSISISFELFVFLSATFNLIIPISFPFFHQGKISINFNAKNLFHCAPIFCPLRLHVRRRSMARGFFSCFGKASSNSNNDDNTTADLTTEEQRRGGPVVVELFTSQGCATSPEAELVFSRLGRGDFNLDVPLILLAYHVDYWDYMGWKDPFGSSQWTVRQKAYVETLNLDTMFTPQIVVQGQAQCMGNDSEALLSCIASAPRVSAPTFQATFQKPTTESLQVLLTGALRTKVDHEGANVMVGLYECSLVTDCPNGPNKGRVLANDYVVRRLDKLCSVKDISAKKTVSGTVNFPLWVGFNAAKCGVAVFVESPSHQIFGSQKFQLPDNL